LFVEVIHPAHGAFVEQHIFADSTRFSTRFADDGLRIWIRNDFAEPLRRPERNHLLMCALHRNRHCIMKQHDHDGVSGLQSGCSKDERQRSPGGIRGPQVAGIT
jgi:hypothetical protein